MENGEPTGRNAVVISERARFSLLSDGLVRLEYAPNGVFENRRTVRAIARPDAVAFQSVHVENGVHVLRGGKLTVRYRSDGKPFAAENLLICDTVSGRPVWQPGQVDNDNLGGVHLAMDCVQRSVIPQGVHSATTDYHENSEQCQLWLYASGREGTSIEGARYSGGLRTLEQLLATQPRESLPSLVRELLRERSKYPPGLLSRAGYFLFNDSESALIDPDSGWVVDCRLPQNRDYYLFYYGRDFAAALRDYRLLFGPSPLPPRYSLGLWYSRYPTFDEGRLRDLVIDFEKYSLPLDVLVLDLPWHERGWSGYDWNLQHIPNPRDFLQFLHDRGIHVTLNLHPGSIPIDDSRFARLADECGVAPGPETVVGDPPAFTGFEFGSRRHAAAFMDVLLQPIQELGVDFWWVDGYVQCTSHAVDSQLWTNHVFQQYTQKQQPARRPMILARTAGFGSHRYPFHFTGDTYSQWEVLRSQVEYTLRAGHMGQSFVSHDIGGHFSDFPYIDPELYCRWVQFGALSPILRLHSANGSERIPWLYGDKALDCFREAVRLRMELLPYLYTLAWESHTQCLPLCRSNCLADPAWEAGYRIWDAYYLGDRIYAAPIVAPGSHRRVVLPPARWYCGRSRDLIESDGATPISIIAEVTDPPPHYIRAGRLVVKQPYEHRAGRIPGTLIVEVYADEELDDVFELYEDDGVSCHGEFARTRFTALLRDGQPRVQIDAATGAFAGQPHQRRYEVRLFRPGEMRSLVTEPLATDKSHTLTIP